MKLSIIGGAGAMAMGTIKDLLPRDEVTSIVLGDVDMKALREREEELASPKVEIRQVDATDAESTYAAIEGSDVCLSAGHAELHVSIMEQCLRAGAHYTDLGGRYHFSRRQLALHDAFKQAGLSAVIGSGITPGISQVQARCAVERLDTVDSIHIYAYLKSMKSPGQTEDDRIVMPTSARTVISDSAELPWVFVDGEMQEVPVGWGRRIVELESCGTREASAMIHSEMATMPQNYAHLGVREVIYYSAAPVGSAKSSSHAFAIMQQMLRAGLGSKDPITVNGVSVIPRDVLIAVLDRERRQAGASNAILELSNQINVRGTRDGVPLEIISDVVPWPGTPLAGGATIEFLTGFPAAVTIRLLGSGVITWRGVNSSEVMVPPEPYFELLGEGGFQQVITERPIES